jgi:hypothetical protein
MTIQNYSDLDPQETQEWLDALEAVLEAEGLQRAHFLLGELQNKARATGVHMPYSANTPYFNTIPVDQEEYTPGDPGMEWRIRSLIRWNALAMVIKANRITSELGGHIASFASSATLYDVGFNHFWHAPGDAHGGDLVFIQGHSAPGIYARAYLEGRLNEQQLDNFRQEVDGNGLSFLPASLADAGFLAVPHRVDGSRSDPSDLSGAVHEVPAQSRHRQHRRSQGLVLLRRRRDGRAGIAGRHRPGRPRKSGQSDLRHQLQPATARRPGARQRQDHPGTGRRFPRQRVGTSSRCCGARIGTRCSPPTRRACC